MARKIDRQTPNSTDELQYVLVRSRRKTLSLVVQNDGQLEIRCPMNYPRWQIDHFVRSKAGWINKKRQENSSIITIQALPAEDKAQACLQIQNHFQQIAAGFSEKYPNGLRIRDQKSRWGSCSSRGQISINCRSVHLPPALRQYIILHELCHLVHLNHSTKFWQLLETYLPEAKKRRQELSRYRLS